MKISLKHYNTEITVELPDDSGFDDVISTITGMFVSDGYSIETILDCMQDEIDKYETYRKLNSEKSNSEI